MTEEHYGIEADWAFLARYLAGDLSLRETAEIEQWIGADPARQEEVAALKKLWSDARSLPSPASIDRMWARIAAELDSPIRSEAVGAKRSQRPA